MAYLISQLWLWLLLAFVLGGVVGWMTCTGGPLRWWSGSMRWGILAASAGVLLAVLRVFPNRMGYILDAGLLMLGSFVIGWVLVCLWRQGQGSASDASVAAISGAVAARIAQPPAPPVAKPVAASAPPAPVAAPVEPPPAPPVEGEDKIPGRKPKTFAAPRGGVADDLKRIRGIGKQNEGRLHGLGIWHFDQIAAWTPSEVRWVGAFLAFPGRIEREDWVGQAAILAKGGETDFSKRADKGLVATSRDETNDDGQSNVISIEKAKPKAGGKTKPAKK